MDLPPNMELSLDFSWFQVPSLWLCVYSFYSVLFCLHHNYLFTASSIVPNNNHILASFDMHNPSTRVFESPTFLSPNTFPQSPSYSTLMICYHFTPLYSFRYISYHITSSPQICTHKGLLFVQHFKDDATTNNHFF